MIYLNNLYALILKPFRLTFCVWHSTFYPSLFGLCHSIIYIGDAIYKVVPFPPLFNFGGSYLRQNFLPLTS